MEIWPGHAYPLGATYDGTGTNFAVPALEGEAPGSLAGTKLKCGAYRVRWDGSNWMDVLQPPGCTTTSCRWMGNDLPGS